VRAFAYHAAACHTFLVPFGWGSLRRFHDRQAAGRDLAAALERYRGRDDVVVLALPRGGVIVAAEVARALGLPLDIMLVRKLGVPGH
jgi:predicted phosphoribosyltransferase